MPAFRFSARVGAVSGPWARVVAGVGLALAAAGAPARAQTPAPAPLPARVFGAASLTDALTDVARLWAARGHPAPVGVFASSSTLARQIENGAPADLFVSAERSWMERLERQGRLQAGSRSELLGNRLVLVAPRERAFPVRLERGFDLPAAFAGRLCTGEPETVPVGVYARQALTALGWGARLAPRVVGAEDARAALAFVERGACAAGVVYATDAAASRKVAVLGVFPEGSHAPIVYPLALVRGARPEGVAFMAFLKGPEARVVFRRHGFTPLGSETAGPGG